MCFHLDSVTNFNLRINLLSKPGLSLSKAFRSLLWLDFVLLMGGKGTTGAPNAVITGGEPPGTENKVNGKDKLLSRYVESFRSRFIWIP